MSWKLASGAIVLAASTMFGLVERTIDEKQPVDVVLSTTSHNRIAVEEGAVEKVFGDSSLFSVNIDPVTGNAFINVVREVGEKGATLTVVTSSGAVQDLRVRSSAEIPSEQIVLKEAVEEEWTVRPAVSHAATMEMLNLVMEGKIPPGYGERELEEEGLKLPAPLESRGVKAIEGPFETIWVYEISNPEEKPVVITSDALKKEGDSWVFLNAHELKEGERALCIIGREKE